MRRVTSDRVVNFEGQDYTVTFNEPTRGEMKEIFSAGGIVGTMAIFDNVVTKIVGPDNTIIELDDMTVSFMNEVAFELVDFMKELMPSERDTASFTPTV